MVRLPNSPEAQPRMALMLPSSMNSSVEPAGAQLGQDPGYYNFNSDPRVFTPEYVQRIVANIIETIYSTRDGSRMVYKCADDVGKEYIVKKIIGNIVVRGDFTNSVKRYEMIQAEGFPFVLPLFYAETFKRSSARNISGTNILITDYVTSESLDKIRGNTKSLAEIKSIRTQLESILSEISARGHVHRDIKGENVVVTPDNRVYLIDFDTLCKQDHRLHLKRLRQR
jgi:serine/threonine protein kinase